MSLEKRRRKCKMEDLERQTKVVDRKEKDELIGRNSGRCALDRGKQGKHKPRSWPYS
jgi:hypothetical protein